MTRYIFVSGGVVSSVGVYGGIPTLSLPTDGSFFHRSIVTTFCPAGSARMEHLLGLIDAHKRQRRPAHLGELRRLVARLNAVDVDLRAVR